MSNDSHFDPCRHWLGIDAVDLADPCRVLGIAPGETNPVVVARAADARLAVLRGISPGPFTLAHDALIRRVEECRDQLLSGGFPAATQTGITGRPSHSGFVPPPAPPAFQAPPAPVAQAATLAVPPPVPWTPAVAVPSPAPVATDPPCADEEDAEPVVISRRSVRRRPPASSNPLPAVLSLLCVATAGIAAYVLWPTDAPWRRRQESSVRRQEQAASKPQPRPESAAAIDRDRPRPGERIPRERLRPSPVPAQPRRGRPVMESGEPDVATPPPQPQPPEPPMEPEPPAADTGRIEKQANRLLGDALSALQNGKFDKADQLVEAMLKLDADAPALGLADRATGWKQLCRNARQFRGFRDRALADVTGDVAIGNSRIVVVESNPKLFVYKEKGVNKRVSPEAIPDHILTAVVAHWFAGAAQPGNHVFLGVQHLIKRKPDPAAARAEWNRASSGGVNTSNLEPLLQDPVITAAAR